MSRYEFIDSQKSEPVNRNPVVKMCRWLEVSTSGFYHWLTRPQSVTSARRQALLVRVRHYFEESDGTYGYRRIHPALPRRREAFEALRRPSRVGGNGSVAKQQGTWLRS